MKSDSIKRGWFAQIAGAFLLAALVSGCQSIPDIAEWNKATKDVSAAVTEGFQSSSNVNGDIAKRLDKILESDPAFSAPSRRYSSVAEALGRRADDYEKVFGAIADYSDSLAAIAKAADNSAKTVDAVAGSVNALAGAIGAIPFAGAAFELGKALANEVIKIKAAKDFGDAVQAADPIVGQVASVVIADLGDLRRTVGITKDEAIRAAIELPYEKRLAYRTALERRRSDLQIIIKAAIAPGPTSPTASPPPTTSLLNVGDAPELAKVEQYLRESDSWYLPYRADLDKALTARAKSEELTIQTTRGVQAWRESHASLVTAVRERRLPDSGRLSAIAKRIRALVDEIKKEK